MKNGTANKAKLSIPVTIFCAEVKMATSKGKMVSIVTMDAAAILTEIGTPRNNNMKNAGILIIGYNLAGLYESLHEFNSKQKSGDDVKKAAKM